jgi:hypothetical protein
MAQFRGSEVHYSASLMKVAAMYAAWELRKVVRSVASELGASTTSAKLLSDVARYLDPQILRQVTTIPALKGIQNRHALPRYATMFDVVGASTGTGFTVNFSKDYVTALDDMIRISDNGQASAVIHGVGYGFLNGALAAAGFISGTTGLWLAGDFTKTYPYFRIPCVNDMTDGQGTAQGATVLELAHEFTLISDGLLVDGPSCKEMLDLLARPLTVPEVFISRASGLNFTVTQTKVGLGPLKRGPLVASEASLLLHTSGKKFVAAWQNLQGSLDSIGHVVRDTIDAFLKP